MYNPHQTGPAGTVVFVPPFRDPFNYNLDPCWSSGHRGRWDGDAQPIGCRRQARFSHAVRCELLDLVERRPENHALLAQHDRAADRDQRQPDTDGDPAGPGSSTAPQRPSIPGRTAVLAFRQAIEYSITVDRAVLDYASRNRDKLLYNIYRMGKNSIERGSRDHWTIHPQRIEALEQAAAADSWAPIRRGRPAVCGVTQHCTTRAPRSGPPRSQGIHPAGGSGGFPHGHQVRERAHQERYHDSPRDQRFPRGRQDAIRAGSYVVKTAQAFRPLVIDMFEPQDHPNDFAVSGWSADSAVRHAGWTLAFQMGVEFDRILDGFDGPFEKIEGFATTPAGTVANAQGAAASC